MKTKFSWPVLGLFFLALPAGACTPTAPLAASRTPTPAPILPGALSPSTFTPFPTQTLTPTPTLTLTLTPTLTLTATPDPYAGLAIADLAGRTYGGGELRIEETLNVYGEFTRHLVSYPSDGLTVYGFMNVPGGEGPFPVVIVLHGYVDPSIYQTLTYTTRYADALASAGYLVIHPNLRNYPPSGEGPNPFRIGFAIDVLNLIALTKEQGGALSVANPEAIGVWGHSMGGGISLRVITVSPDVRAAVLYGSMSGDERRNFERIFIWSGGQSGEAELDTPEEALARISPIYHLDRLSAAVSIHHGEQDEVVPLEWSTELCGRVQALGKPVECFAYSGQPHTFQGEGDQLFIQRTIEFFDAQLKAVR